MDWRKVQEALNTSIAAGLAIDGIPGRRTIAALKTFQRRKLLDSTGTVDSDTLEALFPRKSAVDEHGELDPPWMAVLATKMGLNESRNNQELREFLRSDGATLGDPSKLPWCGDLVETCIALTMPDEPLPTNPYLARNWATFGVAAVGFGAIGAFWRGSRSGHDGHVAFIIGQAGSRFRIRGGNQSNSISDIWIDKNRLLSSRKPSTWLPSLRPLPLLAEDGKPSSQNEV